MGDDLAWDTGPPTRLRSAIRCGPFDPRQVGESLFRIRSIGTWDATDIAKRHVEHQPFRHCLSGIFTLSSNVQCTEQCCTLFSTLYIGRFQRKFCESRLKVGTIPYRTGRMISRAGAQRAGSRKSNCNLDWRGVH